MNFALFSEHAERVELCLFDPADGREARRYDLPEHTDQVWHGFLPEAGAGLVYGYRVHGPFAPERGHRFDPTQVLLDPYARAWAGRFDARGGRPRSVVTPPPPIACGRRPGHDPADLVIYEAHVKGLTARHPDVASHRRGRYAALGEPAVIEHLHGLGITAIELMPCQAFVDEPFLRAKGLRNYWGYNPIGFFVPEPRYAATADAAGELREAVAALHDAGIEVLLDVVYNHTGEGDAQGPTLSFRGIDNRSYYKLDGDPLREVDVTGCGNTFDLAHPRVLQLVMDSLRFWVTSIGVDGFRFDLATALGRSAHGFDAGAGFFDAIRQDPVLAGVRLIAEPWDVGPEGYRLGGFGSSWSEWNDRFRDTVRGFWRGDEHLLPALAARLLGSADLFDHRGRRPFASINYVTAHDGFTLADLVAHEKRHNRANGEDNRDGHAHEISWNNGVEGPSDDPAVRDARARDMRNMLTTLFLAQGTPMLLMGDEIGRSQRGNNNAYCQDNPLTWMNWSGAGREKPPSPETTPHHDHPDETAHAEAARWRNAPPTAMAPEEAAHDDPHSKPREASGHAADRRADHRRVASGRGDRPAGDPTPVDEPAAAGSNATRSGPTDRSFHDLQAATESRGDRFVEGPRPVTMGPGDWPAGDPAPADNAAAAGSITTHSGPADRVAAGRSSAHRVPAADLELLAFVHRLAALRRRHPVFRRKRFMHGEEGNVRWWHPSGREMRAEDWSGRTVGLLLDGRRTGERRADGTPLTDDVLLVVLTSADDPSCMVLPEGTWHKLLDTRHPDAAFEPHPVENPLKLDARSVVVLRRAD